MKLCYPTNFWV